MFDEGEDVEVIDPEGLKEDTQTLVTPDPGRGIWQDQELESEGDETNDRAKEARESDETEEDTSYGEGEKEQLEEGLEEEEEEEEEEEAWAPSIHYLFDDDDEARLFIDNWAERIGFKVKIGSSNRKGPKKFGMYVVHGTSVRDESDLN